jgi:hypothetical protein
MNSDGRCQGTIGTDPLFPPLSKGDEGGFALCRNSWRRVNSAKMLIAIVAALVMSQPGCAGPGRRPAPVPAPQTAPAPPPQQAAPAQNAVSLVESFMRKVVASAHEAAFADLDIRLLVNYGRPQWELYSALQPGEQERYRRDFIEGIYAFLFKDLPPAQASWSVVAPDPGSPVVEVTGRSGKVLRLVVQKTPAGLKIVMIERG